MAKSRGGAATFLNIMAFVAFALVGLALLIFIIIGSTDVGRAFLLIGQIVAYVIVGVISFIFAFARAKRGRAEITWIIIWIIAAVAIVLAVVFDLANVR